MCLMFEMKYVFSTNSNQQALHCHAIPLYFPGQPWVTLWVTSQLCRVNLWTHIFLFLKPTYRINFMIISTRNIHISLHMETLHFLGKVLHSQHLESYYLKPAVYITKIYFDKVRYSLWKSKDYLLGMSSFIGVSRVLLDVLGTFSLGDFIILLWLQ